MSSRKHAFLETVRELEKEFCVRFPDAPTTSNQPIIDRVRRSLSWLRRAAEISDEDLPPRFVDLWIALNALYGQARYTKEFPSRDKDEFGEFVQRVTELHSGHSQLSQLINEKHFQTRAQELVRNKYLWNEWWAGNTDKYREHSGEGLVRFGKSVTKGDPAAVLCCLFERLQVLRNQIVHGSSSASTRKSRDALYPAILLLEETLPEFIRLMIREGPDIDWPPVPFPGKDTPQFPDRT